MASKLSHFIQANEANKYNIHYRILASVVTLYNSKKQASKVNNRKKVNTIECATKGRAKNKFEVNKKKLQNRKKPAA